MILNYLKIAWRNIIKRKFLSLLNITGLALAIACSFLIYLFVSYQLSFDNYHKSADKIFRVVYELHLDKTEYDNAGSYAIYDLLRTQSASVKQAAMSVSGQSFTVSIDGKNRFREEKNISFADADWFKLFSYQWLQGSPLALNEPNTAVLTQSMARKYFGSTNPINQIITVDDKPVKIAGLIADNPYNSDLRSAMYLSFVSLKTLLPKTDAGFFKDWGYLNSGNNVFVALNNTGEKSQVENLLASVTKKKFGPKNPFVFRLLPLRQMHFDTNYGGAIQKSLLLILGTIGLLILVVACINYVNLAIAQQTRRSVEIGTRKVLGGSAKQLFLQFMVESALNTILALIIAVITTFVLLPQVNHLLFADNPVYIISYQNLLWFSVSLFAFITIGTGIYPAMILSRINVFQALKNNLLNLPGDISRKMLIIFQNTVAQALIACTIIILMQVNFLRNTDKGFDRKFVVMIPVTDATVLQKEQLNQALKSIPGIQAFSYCRKSPSSDSKMGATVLFDDRPKWEAWPARFVVADSAYCKTFGLHIVAGRDIRNNRPKPEFLINEKMAAMLSSKNPADVIGKNLNAGDTKGTIVGIVKDFAVKSLINPIEPTVLLEDKYWQNTLAVKLSGKNTSAELTTLQNKFTTVFPDKVFNYSFVDDQIAALYKTEILQQKLIWIAAIIAIAISSMGLLGLISLIVLQRTKEMGIRKVLGASAAQISLLLSADLLKLIFVALAIATPVAWWCMNKWVQGFAYRVEIQWWQFMLAGAVALLIALITICIQAVKAATANPVKSLRSE